MLFPFDRLSSRYSVTVVNIFIIAGLLRTRHCCHDCGAQYCYILKFKLEVGFVVYAQVSQLARIAHENYSAISNANIYSSLRALLGMAFKYVAFADMVRLYSNISALIPSRSVDRA